MAGVSLPGVGVSLTSTGVSLNTNVALRTTTNGIAASGVNVVAGNSFNAASIAIFNAFTTPPTAARKVLINTTVLALQAAGVWSLLDLLYVLAAADGQAALINWVNPSSFALTAVNSPAFVTDRGYTGDGSTSWLDTGWSRSVNAVQLTQNFGHVGAFALTAGTAAQADFGAGVCFVRVRAGNLGFIAVNTGAASLQGPTGGTLPLHIMGVRLNDASNQLYFRNGADVATGAAASQALTNADFGVAKVGAAFSNRQMAAAHVGGGLTDTQGMAAYSALLTYMQGVGAA